MSKTGETSEKPRPEKDVFSDLAALCISPGYIHAIAYLCSRDNSIGIGETLTPNDIAEKYTPQRLIRTEISTLIGLLVRQPIDFSLPNQLTFQKYIETTETLLEELHWSMAFEGFGSKSVVELVEKQINPFANGQSLREPIFYGGESAYAFQYREFSQEKYSNDDDWLKANKQFSIEDAANFAQALASFLNEKQLKQIKSLQDIPKEQWTVLPAYKFSAEEFSSHSNIDLRKVEAILDAFSFPHSNRNNSFISLSDYNATNAQPIIRYGSDGYILLQYYSLVEALYESPFYWMCADDAYKDKSLKHRGDFAEKLSRDCLLRVFKPHHVFNNVRIFRGKDEIGEIDALVSFGPYIVLVQAKSKRLTLASRKGNDHSVKDDFKKAVQNSYDQSLICAKSLTDSGIRLVDGANKEIKLKEAPTKIFPICIVSDHYPALAFQARQFLRTEITDIIFKPLIMDVFALDTITEMLPSSLYFLSYLHRRAKFSDKIIATHENTFLSYHLKHNLWADESMDFINLGDDFCAHLDAAMTVRREGFNGEREPDGILTKYKGTKVADLISQIEAQEGEAPVDLGFLLLELGEETVKILNDGIKKIISQARSDMQSHDITVAFPSPSAGLTIHVNRDPKRQALDKLDLHCQARMHTQKADQWFGIVLDPVTEKVRVGMKIISPWKPNSALDAALKTLRVRPLTRDGAHLRKIGRNDKCICGSEKKYKKCCGAHA